MEITPDCEDPLYNAKTFVVDRVAQATTPMPHTRVEAHFSAPTGQSSYKVTLYLPSATAWEGRFFQHAYPLEQPENPGDIAFALGNGAYLVNVAGVPCGCGGYRPDAAAAKIARRYAQDFYKSDRTIRGYLWGGSGGGLVTAGAMEHTRGVWDGAVPYVMPNAASLANVNASGSLSGLALGGRLTTIADAVAPGSGTSPFAGLNAEEHAILAETLALGTPLATFETPGMFGGGSNPLLMVLTAGVKEKDPAYVEDFWSKPGYEGANPPGYLKGAIRDEWATVTEVGRDAEGRVASIKLDRAPSLGTGPLAGMSFEYWLYDAGGRTKLGELGGRLDKDTIWQQDRAPGATGQLGQGIEALLKRTVLGAADSVAPGQKVLVNNRNFLALHFYHRHAMPLDRDMYPYDVLRAADGKPLYPQRSYLAATESATGTAGGGRQTGEITMKVILVQSMVDGGAQPWMADWYAKRVRTAIGAGAYARNFRLYLNDNAGHLDIPPPGKQAASSIDYVPALHQAVLDVMNWVERGKAPPASSRYAVTGGQLNLAATAARRGGIQPVVELEGGRMDRIEASVGQAISFRGTVSVPPAAGKVVSTAWWFGDEAFALVPETAPAPSSRLNVERTHVYSKPGTYFVTLWAASQREGKPRETGTAVQNLDRIRVVVR
ncbi:PKD domain-containing protein [Novosphingobium sp. PS1R-30]|uniref:PKD domain-containing protein n=1 Tax=Novosphingobium anseongense TaxID=3133436 RepID=A0ABU8S1D8_9SPHN